MRRLPSQTPPGKRQPKARPTRLHNHSQVALLEMQGGVLGCHVLWPVRHGNPQGGQFTVLGHPQGKKNRNQIAINKATKRQFIVPEAKAKAWAKFATGILRIQKWGVRWETVQGPVLVIYDIYRHADRGDLSNYDNAIDDVLQSSGLIADDKQVVTRISRKHLTVEQERVDIMIFPIGDPTP